MANDDTPDVADVISKNGKLYAVIGSAHVPLKFSKEAKSAILATMSPEPAQRARKIAARTSTTPAGRIPASAQRFKSAAQAAAERFDAEPAVRRMYGLTTSDPDDPQYVEARKRHVAAARRRDPIQG